MFSLKPVEGKAFLDREELLEELMCDITTTSYAFYGRRRIGKTSLLKELRRRLLAEKDIIPVYFSLWDLVDFSLLNFTKQFTSAILEEYKNKINLKIKSKNLIKSSISLIKDVVKELKLSIDIKETVEILLSSNIKTDMEKLVENCFYLPEYLARETNTKCVLLIDEFPDLMELQNGAKVGETLIRKLRTISENYTHTTMCIAGSIKHTMNIAVFSSTSAFYGQMVVREIKPFDIRYVTQLLNMSLKLPQDAIDEIYNFSNGIPFYVQFLGKMLKRKEKVTLEILKSVVYEFIHEEGTLLFKESFNKLTSKEKGILIAIVNGYSRPSEISKELDADSSVISVYLRYLQEKGFISKGEEAIYTIDDPVFSRWIKETVILN